VRKFAVGCADEMQVVTSPSGFWSQENCFVRCLVDCHCSARLPSTKWRWLRFRDDCRHRNVSMPLCLEAYSAGRIHYRPHFIEYKWIPSMNVVITQCTTDSVRSWCINILEYCLMELLHFIMDRIKNEQCV